MTFDVRGAAFAPVRSTGVAALRMQLAIGAALAAATAVVAVVDPNQPGHYPTCPFLWLTGRYCPGCGGLRAVHDLAHGDLSSALSRNVLVAVGAPVAVLLWAVSVFRLLTGRPPLRLARWWLVAPLGLLVAVFWVVRNTPWGASLAP